MENEDSLRTAINLQCNDIYDNDGVLRFLNNSDTDKNIGTRLICWLIRSRIIPSARSEWIQRIISRYRSYKNICDKHFGGDIDSPLNKVDTETAFSINADTKRTKTWYFRQCECVGLASDIISDSEIRAQRILSLLSLENNSSYTQGNDRFAWVSLIVSLYFTSKSGLNPLVAEALAYFLTVFFVEINPISQNIENFSYVEYHFSILDDMISEETPHVYELLKSANHKSMHYALKWELTLFADEHSILNLLFIWDKILSFSDDIIDYVRWLCIAHIRQVPIPQMADEMAESIQRYRGWDVQKIINETDQKIKETTQIGISEHIRMMFFECCSICHWDINPK